MDLRLKIKELATHIGVNPDIIINWELKDVKPSKRNQGKIKKFLELIDRNESLST